MTYSQNPHTFLSSLFDEAVRAALPDVTIARHLPKPPKGRTVVVGAGKGAAQMAQSLERAWSGELTGVVVTRYGYGAVCKNISVIEAGHPVPDAAGARASEALIEAVSNLTEDDLVIALIAGGGSALLPAPLAPLTLEDEIAVNEVLLASGAPIAAMNTIRKHISAIKGGRLALAAYPARVHSLVVSDIPGDIAHLVASGPTIADEAGRQEAFEAIKQYKITLPQAVLTLIETGNCAAPKPDDPKLSWGSYNIIASAAISLEAAANAARKQGIEAYVLSDAIEGEAREVARMHAAMARFIKTSNQPFSKPVLVLSGGETTVTITEKGGKGGRNSDFALSFAREIENIEGITLLAADTDGIDGSEDNAGAFADGGSTMRMRAAGIDPSAALARHDAFTAFQASGDIFHTGPTGTNVNDFRAILIL